jgi:hypothetical protein
LIEKRKLLLVAEHLDGWFAKHREVERRMLGAGVGEDDLVRQSGLPASGRASDDIERKLGKAAAKDFIQARHAGGQPPNFNSLRFSTFTLFAHDAASISKYYSSTLASGHASRTNLSVSGWPINVISSASK